MESLENYVRRTSCRNKGKNNGSTGFGCLGSLYAGDASRNTDTVNNSKNYGQHFMNYIEEQSHLIIQIFRHKLVHLAQPNFVYQDKSKSRRVTWSCFHDDREKHLRIEKLPPNSKILVTSY